MQNEIFYSQYCYIALPYLELGFKDSKLTECLQIVCFSNVAYEWAVVIFAYEFSLYIFQLFKHYKPCSLRLSFPIEYAFNHVNTDITNISLQSLKLSTLVGQ